MSNNLNLILVGGGHTHALVLKHWMAHPIDNVQITLISPHSHSPYSGMLPGLLAGYYTFSQTHIDLQQLAHEANIEFIQQPVTAIDHLRQCIYLADGQQHQYDIASINVGSTPNPEIPGSQQHATPVKPIAEFLQHWQRLQTEIRQQPNQRIAIIGGGAGSVEVALAMAHALKPWGTQLSLITRAGDILSEYPRKARRLSKERLALHGIEVLTNMNVDEIHADGLSCSGQKYSYEHIFLCTQAAAANWFRQSGLATDQRGFITVNNYLQTTTAGNLFAAGDCAHFQSEPLPKAGVYAVREADILFHNLQAACQGTHALKPYQPQRDFLSLLAMGDHYAIGCKFGLTVSGHWVWRWKDQIDRHFMARFNAG
ncbi:FAD-dependent oxidoreductase [Gynuella sunshinyii]|uniref:NADH dehydrogenase, FAD-containing subunit n=1 Tax=Gynuella sunshinyii YC6258 TaxID=1445510 RepID=A0A0C5VB41_9GAMM|nr:FAD-dependent oxidoreductase [Gynuella sunshinyii]AJQ96565.1 NADH dehydrogenase, FAD-containing subunit [Gynuella sunshinyii YC6258]